ncbi:MAG: hypothetical protein HY319_14790 [Armatimonadetes bacterium]|nr:hypothetical protein [Armatimonadota bacterium]
MTLLEVLISAGMLLVLTSVALQVLIPMMTRYSRVDARQENMQRGIILQELMVRDLTEARIRAIYADRVEYYMPQRLDTPMGRLDQVGTDEMVAWNIYDLHILDSDVLPDASVIVQQRVVGTNPATRTLWNLGEGGSLSFDYSRKPLLKATVTSTLDRTPGTPPWTRNLFVVVEE